MLKLSTKLLVPLGISLYLSTAVGCAVSAEQKPRGDEVGARHATLPTTIPAPHSATVGPAATATPPAGEWRPVAEWEGMGLKTTETFHIDAREWRISWDSKAEAIVFMDTTIEVPGGGIMQIYVYRFGNLGIPMGGDGSGSLYTVAANTMGESHDSSIVRGSGDFYLTINSTQSFTVRVEQR